MRLCYRRVHSKVNMILFVLRFQRAGSNRMEFPHDGVLESVNQDLNIEAGVSARLCVPPKTCSSPNCSSEALIWDTPSRGFQNRGMGAQGIEGKEVGIGCHNIFQNNRMELPHDQTLHDTYMLQVTSRDVPSRLFRDVPRF